MTSLLGFLFFEYRAQQRLSMRQTAPRKTTVDKIKVKETKFVIIASEPAVLEFSYSACIFKYVSHLNQCSSLPRKLKAYRI